MTMTSYTFLLKEKSSNKKTKKTKKIVTIHYHHITKRDFIKAPEPESFFLTLTWGR